MKKRAWIILAGLSLACLTACGQKGTPAESRWAAARKADDTASYVKEHKEELGDLKAEAESAETLGQQFKAVALLCMAEYQENLSSADPSRLDGWDNKDVFLFDYPGTSAYADAYFAKVNTDEAAFWESLEDAYYPYDYFLPMMAATKNLDGQTLSKLLKGMPEDGKYKTELEEAIEAWVKNRPGSIVSTGDVLMEMGYFDDWKDYDWTGTYLYSSVTPYLVRTDTAEDGLAYVRYMKGALIPGMEAKLGRDTFFKTSGISGEEYYATGLAVTVGEDLQLPEPGEGSSVEEIVTEGKKVAAFYHNPSAGEDADAPPAWQVMGDFMMGLSDEEFPAALSEADYYLVLTADHQYGNYYQDQSGNQTKVQAVYSSTSIDLYDAKSNTFLCHVGNVMENPSGTIFKDLNEESAQYPELVPADALSYIYHNISNPDSYRVLLDNTSSQEEPLRAGGTGLLGPWEITMDSLEIVESFEDGMFSYSASDGCRFVRGHFTVTNRGFEQDSFLAGSYYMDGDNLVYAGVTDGSEENYYPSVDATTYSACLNGKTLEVGESKEGEVLFEIPDAMADGSAPLYIFFNMRNQALVFSAEQ